MRTFLTHALCFALLGVASFAGSSPELINYQGVLRDPAGVPLNGDYDMVFRFWSDPSGGEEIFLDSHTLSLSTAVAVSRGLFSVALGGGDLSDGSGPGAYANLGDVFRDYGAVYVGIQIDSDPEMVPRIPVLASPYALNADRIDGRDASDFVSTDGGTLTGTLNLAADGLVAGTDQLVLSGGRVGMGTPTPGTALDVVGAIRSDNQLISTLANGTAPLSVSSLTKVANLNVDLLDGLDSSEFLTSLGGSLTGTLTLAPNGLVAGTDQFVLNSGRVGVGTAAPGNKLHVFGGGLTVDGASTASSISLLAGAAPNNGLGGAIDLKAGTGYNMRGGHMTLQAGRSSSWSGAGQSADAWLRGGQMEAAVSSFAEVHVEGGKVVSGGSNESNGGRLVLSGGNGNGTNRAGGDILLQPGAATGSGTPGNVGVGTPSPGARLDVSGGDIRTDGQLVSTVATGQAPLSVASTTRVANFNADFLDGEDASSFARTVDLHGRYTNGEAVEAMGAKSDSNPLHHDRPAALDIAESSPRRKQIALRKWYEVSTTTSFAVGLLPGAVVFDGSNVWVANRASDTVSKLRASDGELLGSFSVGSVPVALAFDGANIWVGNYADGTVTKLRAYDGALLDTISLGTAVNDVVFDGTSIWVAHPNIPGTVSKVRPSDGVTLGTYGSAGDCAVGLEFDGTNLWIANSCGSGIVTKMNPSDGSHLGTYGVFNCKDIAFDGSDLWVSSGSNGEVVRLRASDGAKLGTSPVGSQPAGVTFDGTNVWVANSGNNTVTKLRASDGTTLGTFATGGAPAFIVFDGAAIWVTNENDGTVSKM